MKRAAVLVIATAALAAPASALASPQLAVPIPSARPSQAGAAPAAQLPLNYASNRKALGAYASYLTALLNGAPSGVSNATAFISTISSGCRSALAPLTQPNEQVNTAVQHTLTVLGEEMGDDLSISFDQSAVAAFAKFTTALSRLRWTRLSGWSYTVRHYINAENSVLALTTSNLCVNASSAALRPAIVPEATKTFIKAYNETSKAANAALTNLTRMMQAYEIPSERTLVARIANLASEVSSQTRAALLQSGSALTSVLESN